MSTVFIWTEAINCGELLAPFIKSFVAHHSIKLNVYGKSTDLEMVNNLNFENIIKHNVADFGSKFEKKLDKYYQSGHKGTAYLWSYLMKSRPEVFMIHLDADTIFIGDSLTEILEKLTVNKFSLVGSRRPYKKRTYRKFGLDGFLLNMRPDVVNTDCFGFDKRYVRKFPTFWLRRKIQGRRCSLKPVIDFFDPVSFEIMQKKGKIFYLDSMNEIQEGEFKSTSDFCASRITFTAVGSGINFYKNPETKSSSGYREFALSSYSLYSKWVLGKDLGLPMMFSPELESKLSRLDTKNWRLNPKN